MSTVSPIKRSQRGPISAEKGFTLVEVISYFGLCLMLLSIMGLFLFSVFKQYAFIGDRFTLKKISSLIVREIKRDCESSTLRAITPGDKALMIQPFNSVDPPALYVWSDKIICYRYDSSLNQISRWTQDLSTFPGASAAPNPYAFSPSDTQGLTPPAGGQPIKNWGFVEDFAVSKESSSLLKVTLSLYLKDAKEHEHRYKLEQTLQVQNGYDS